MKKVAILAACAAALGGAALFTTGAAGAASSADAVRAVQTASRGQAAKPTELDRERKHWEVTFANGVERKVSLDGRRVTSTRQGDDRTREATGVGLVAALRAAAPRVKGTIEDAELEDGVWTVGIADSDVEVDPRNGRVLRVTQDD
jgi:uncharacterized membrane protein YkoI